jgi:hypothetical protein
MKTVLIGWAILLSVLCRTAAGSTDPQIHPDEPPPTVVVISAPRGESDIGGIARIDINAFLQSYFGQDTRGNEVAAGPGPSNQASPPSKDNSNDDCNNRNGESGSSPHPVVLAWQG